MNRIIKILVPSCKKATALIDKKLVSGLSIRETVALKLHTSMCDFCTQYEKQSALLHDLLRKHARENEVDQVEQLVNDALKEKIKSSL